MQKISNKTKILLEYLNEMFPNPVCELKYIKDYELLIAVMLSAQSTDKTVNKVTEILFDKYNTLEELSKANMNDLIKIIRPCGSFNKKSVYTKEIAKILLKEHNGIVPKDRESLEAMPGVGRKTASVVLSELFHIPAIAVDTHVERVSKRLKLASDKDTPKDIEKKLMKIVPEELWCDFHYQMVLFGRYHCQAKKPQCTNCKLKDNLCKWKKN